MYMNKCKGKVVAMLVMAVLAQSCDLGDLTDTLDGTEEKYVIADKNFGTQQVDEAYAAEAAYFEVEDNSEELSAIEFFPDGSYQLLYGVEQESYAPLAPDAESEVTIPVGGRKVKMSMPGLKRSQAPASPGKGRRGTYTYENGVYTLLDLDWTVSGNTLYIRRDGEVETVSATRAANLPESVLTTKISHVWELKEVLVKLYNSNTRKLVATYKFTDEEMKREFIRWFIFSRVGNFYRYDYYGENNGNGVWTWTNPGEQVMHMSFRTYSLDNPIPVYGEFNEQIYFSNNHLYIADTDKAMDDAADRYAEEESDDEDDVLYYGVSLAQLVPVGYFKP